MVHYIYGTIFAPYLYTKYIWYTILVPNAWYTLSLSLSLSLSHSLSLTHTLSLTLSLSHSLSHTMIVARRR